MLKRHAGLISFSMRFFDIAIVLVSAYLAFMLRFGIGAHFYQEYALAVLLGCVVSFLSFTALDIYAPLRGKRFYKHLKKLFYAWAMIAFVLTLCAFFTKTGVQFSRIWLGEWMILGLLLSWISRSVIYLALSLARKHGFNIRRVVVVGAGELGTKTMLSLQQEKRAGYLITHCFDEEPALQGTTIAGVVVAALPADVEQFIIQNRIDEVWIALPLQQEQQIKELLHQLRFSTVNIQLVPSLFGLSLLNGAIFEIAGLPVLSLRATPITGIHRVLKWLEDHLLALLILLVISPVMLAIALAVKCSSPGPIFYRQERVSWSGKTFMMLKFRSMPVNAEAKTGATWAKPGEQRATRMGAFLRKTSLDELPQFINVLKGDMSIVGPRPERPVFIDQFKNEIPGYMQKHLVKAGITGWAQINGWRGSTDLQKRIDCDLYYVEHWSLWFDLKIIFLTIFKGFVNKNAY